MLKASLLEADGLFNTARNVLSPYLPADFRDPFQYDAEPLGLEVPYDQYAAGQLQESFAWDPTLTDTEVKEFHGVALLVGVAARIGQLTPHEPGHEALLQCHPVQCVALVRPAVQLHPLAERIF